MRPSRLRYLLQEQDMVLAPVKSVYKSGEWSHVAICGIMPYTVAWEVGRTRTAPCSCHLQECVYVYIGWAADTLSVNYQTRSSKSSPIDYRNFLSPLPMSHGRWRHFRGYFGSVFMSRVACRSFLYCRILRNSPVFGLWQLQTDMIHCTVVLFQLYRMGWNGVGLKTREFYSPCTSVLFYNCMYDCKYNSQS